MLRIDYSQHTLSFATLRVTNGLFVCLFVYFLYTSHELPPPQDHEGTPTSGFYTNDFCMKLSLIVNNEVVTIQLTVGPPAKQGRYKSVPSSYTYFHFLSNK